MNVEHNNRIIETVGSGMMERLTSLKAAFKSGTEIAKMLEDVQRYCYFTHYNIQALKERDSAQDEQYLPLEQLLFSILNCVLKEKIKLAEVNDLRMQWQSLIDAHLHADKARCQAA